MDKLIEEIMQTPSIQEAIKNGQYTEAEARAEFSDQIENGGLNYGLLQVDDLARETRKKLTVLVDPKEVSPELEFARQLNAAGYDDYQVEQMLRNDEQEAAE